MLNARIRALAVKDLRLHAASIAASHVAVLTMGAAALLVLPNRPRGDLAQFLFMLNFLFAGYWGDWFVSREKMKGTSAWLRSLPVTDFDLATSKLVAQAVCIASLWGLSTGLIVWNVFVPGRLGTWLVLLLVLLAFGSVSLACRWRFHQKLGQILPFALAAALVGASLLLDRVAPGVARPAGASWARVPVKVGIAGALVACYGIAWWATVAWMRRSDTSRLLE